jgi:riboflavin kinase/FMN adenylyltransferase
MDVIKVDYNNNLQFNEDVVAVLGQFDGLHKGHIELIEEAKKWAHEQKMKVAVITFDPHPDYVLKKRDYNGYLTPLPRKLELLQELGIDYVVVIHFDLPLSQLNPEDFYQRYLASINTIVVGNDYRYGFKGKGNVETLKATGKKVIACNVLTYDDQKIGSNMIRELLMAGDVEKILMLLNHPYNITGIVSHGSQVGRTLGIRTANIELIEDYQIIKKGVYVVKVEINGNKYLGVCNVGNNPSINTVERMRLEVHIFDFEDEIYGEKIGIDFIKRIRDEIYFHTKEELVAQIHKDIEFARQNYQGEL